MTDNIAIKVENLTKVYHLYDKPRDRFKEALHPFRKSYHHDFFAVNDINFEIKKGETVGIIGKNGAGKSTLLKMITGVLTPKSGNIQVNGKIASLLELGAGFNPEMTGLENIYLNGTLMGFSQQEMDSKVDAILEFADIGEFISQPVKAYSSGMFARLAFSVAINAEPDVLIVDEALSVGDVFFVQKCMRFLREFMKERTVLFVSHDTAAVLNLCQKAILLEGGIVSAQGEPKDITERYIEKLYESQQGESVKQDENNSSNADNPDTVEKSPRDMRLDYINQTTLRNDIELFPSSIDGSSFGKGGADITKVELLDEYGAPLSWLVGGEQVNLVIHCLAIDELLDPIVGFQVKDRLGQVVFADNTYLTYIKLPWNISKSRSFFASFEFDMPIMPVGGYSVSTAIAEGTQDKHVQHRWIHDALVFKVHTSSTCHGLIGVPMQKIKMEKL